VIRRNKYGLYWIPDNQLHRPVAASVAKGDVWEEETISYIIENLNGKSVITAGTYFGDFLPALSKATNGTVFTYEPVPELFECAKRTIYLNKLQNVVIRNVALSDTVSHVNIQLWGKRKDHINASGKRRLLGGASKVVLNSSPNTLKVQSLTLDSTIPADCEISVVQLDVEGHEEKTLRGALRLLKINLPIIIVETLSQRFFKKYLSPLGYVHDAKVSLGRRDKVFRIM
jgi:FkbM family methyltransferase